MSGWDWYKIRLFVFRPFGTFALGSFVCLDGKIIGPDEYCCSENLDSNKGCFNMSDSFNPLLESGRSWPNTRKEKFSKFKLLML